MLGWELSVNVSTAHWFFGRRLRQQFSGGSRKWKQGHKVSTRRWAQDSARLHAYRGLQCTLSSRSWLPGCYLQFPAACNVKLYKLGSLLWACTKTSDTYLFHIISSKWLQGSLIMMLISFVPCDAFADRWHWNCWVTQAPSGKKLCKYTIQEATVSNQIQFLLTFVLQTSEVKE
jgi:hypothetical protein